MNNDKKKMIVLGALGLVLVAVGAFTFVGGASPTPPPTAKASAEDKAKNGEGTEKDGQKEQTPEEKLVAQFNAGELPTRDPFAPDVVAVVTPPVQQTPTQTPPRVSSGGVRRPSGLRGNVPPFNPMGGGFGGDLPPASGGGIGIEPGAALRSPDDPGYRVKGVIQGRKPMAVLEDGSGNQKLVPVGGSVDGDTQVTGIEKGKVRVRHRGKDKVLDLEEGTK